MELYNSGAFAFNETLGIFQWINSGKAIQVASVFSSFKRCLRIFFQTADVKCTLGNSKARLYGVWELCGRTEACVIVVQLAAVWPNCL